MGQQKNGNCLFAGSKTNSSSSYRSLLNEGSVGQSDHKSTAGCVGTRGKGQEKTKQEKTNQPTPIRLPLWKVGEPNANN
jgi:hypothetical protein